MWLSCVTTHRFLIFRSSFRGGAFDAAEYIVRSKVEFAESLLSSFTTLRLS